MRKLYTIPSGLIARCSSQKRDISFSQGERRARFAVARWFRASLAFFGLLTVFGALSTSSQAATTWLVDSLTDTPVAGQTTLRQAITAAKAGDTIEFAQSLFTGALPKTITLSSALVASKNLTIVGPADTFGTQTPALRLMGPSTGDRILQITSRATATVAGMTFQGGNATGGGAVLVDAGATGTFLDCDFTGNSATGTNSGGAILNNGTLTLDSCLVTLNHAANGGGLASFGKLQLVRSLVEGNTASVYGGGLYAGGSDLWLESSTFSGNAGGTGGAIAFVSGNGKTTNTATVTAVTVVDNTADAQSGGLYVEGAGAVANVGGSVFARNVTTNNGGAQTPHDLATQNSGKINSADYNIVIKPGSTFSPYGAHDQIGVDPLLLPLANYGGRTRTYAIGQNSPAYNNGSPSFAGSLITTDQRGFPRVWLATSGGRADVGAFEFTIGLTCPANVVVEATGPMTPATLNATLILPTAGSASVVWTVGGVAGTPTTVTIPTGGQPQTLTYNGSFAFGATPVGVRVTAGTLVLTCSMTVTVVDTTPPKITLLGGNPYYVEYGTVYNDPGATASDLLDGNVPVTVDASGVNTSALGSYLVYFRAVDAAGNQANASRVVGVRDTVPPVIGAQSNLVVEATSAAGAVVTFAPSASDNVGTPTVTTSPVSGSTFPLGTTTVTITAKDGSGNTATSSFTVTVRDTTAPVITAPNVIVEATSAAGAVATFAPTATDAVSTATVTTSPVSGSTFALGTTPVTVTAKDAAGNTATSTFNVIVQDTTAPVIAAQADMTVLATGAFGALVDLAPIATDAVSAVTVTTSPASGTTFPLGTTKVTITAVDVAGNKATSTFNLTVIDPYGVTLKNVVWPQAIDLTPNLVPSTGKLTGVLQQAVAQAGESRWYKFKGLPDSRIEVTITKLPANLDLVVYTDIQQAYDQLLALTAASSSPADKTLALLGVEYAPESYAPEQYSPEAYSPEQYSPEAYSPEAYSPEVYSPEQYSPEAYSPEIYSPEAYAPEAYAPEAYAPEQYAPEIYSPEAYASAQQSSLLAFSALPGTLGEGVRFSTYSKTGEFYVRVRGQNGVFSNKYPYELTVTINGNLSSGVTEFGTTPSTSAGDVAGRITGSPTSLIVWDRARIAGTAVEKDALAASLATLATAVNGVVVDVNTDAQIVTLNAQADANRYSPITKNLVGDAIRNLIQLYRKAAPGIADVTLVGNDDVIPFFRSNDQALLANEANYFPPVLDGTHSQSALRYSQVLSQDRYGSSQQLVLATGPYDLPDLPVGRLVETAVEVKAYVDKYATLFNGTASSGIVPTPKSAFVAGYDFLADSAEAVKGEFTAGLGAGATVDSLISPITQAPALGWTADQLRAAFLGSRHDVSYLAGHFSTSRALAADYTTRMQAQEVASSTLNLAYALVLSAGCHSGYSTVDKDATLLTGKPDWAQAFSRKQAIWISGTGYQYGDTDFVEYTERLILEVTRALRTGTGPVAIGRAMVEAKRRYLSDTAAMRGIHEKTLLELALYGLPMVKFNLPGARLSLPSSSADISGVVGVTTGPGTAHALKLGELAFNPVLTLVNKTLNVVGSTATTTASYYTGSDGIVTIPGEPVRPLESFNVSRPEGLVRGVGFRSGNYTDIAGFKPFTGAPATETRGVHGRFSTEVFYPVRPWNLNQVGEFFATNGFSELNVFPTQFISDDPNAVAGTLRRYGSMKFNVFYSSDTSVAALANAPAINAVASTTGASTITFSIDAAATAGAGVQEVWITYTGLPGSPHYGSWQSFTLTAPSNTTGIGTWAGTLSLIPGADPGQIRFVVQAVNGFGSVTLDTNFGRYFTPGTSTLDGIGETGSLTTVKLLAPVPSGGAYRSSVLVSASLINSAGQPLSGRRIQFRIGPVIKTVFTNATGVASTNLVLTAQPGAYALEANFAGDLENQNSSDRLPFTVSKMATQLTFDSGITVPDAAHVVVSLRAIDGTPIKERTVAFLLNNGSTTTAVAEITDGAGQARLSNAGIPAGTYQVTVFFAKPVTLSDGTIVSLSDALYEGSTATQSFKLGTSLQFGDVQAWVAYSDPTAPGATSDNQGVSKVEITGDMSSSDPSFGATSMLSKPKAKTVTADMRVTLSGKTIVTGSVVLDVQATDNKHWRGDATLNGAAVQLYVDWDGSGGTGKYHVWVNAPSGSGPLYSVAPALLTLELTFGTGAGEKPAGGVSEIGGSAYPWTQETTGSRVRSH